MGVDDQRLGRVRHLRQLSCGADGNAYGAAHQRTYGDQDGERAPQPNRDARCLRYQHSIAYGNQHTATCSHQHINADRDTYRHANFHEFPDIYEHVATNPHGVGDSDDLADDYSNHTDGPADVHCNLHVNELADEHCDSNAVQLRPSGSVPPGRHVQP